MALLETRDGTRLFYRDWGQGEAVVFVASSSFPSDIWNYNVPPLVESGMRCIAFDRRGHGRSDEPTGGYDLDTLAEGLHAVLARLDLRGATLVGHSLGGAEVIHYLARCPDEGRVRRAVLMAPTAPLMAKQADNPEGIEPAAFEAVRAGWKTDFARWVAQAELGAPSPHATRPPAILVPVQLRRDGLVLDLFTTIATLGTPLDITLQELRIETFFPVDAMSRAAWEAVMRAGAD